MKEKRFWLPSTVIVCLLLVPLSAKTAESQLKVDKRVQLLEVKLQERDKVILELLDRIEALEQRVGVNVRSTRAADDPAISEAPAQNHTADAAIAEQDSEEPGRIVVKESEAERALERSLIRVGALLLAPGNLEIEPGLSFSRREDTTPQFLSSGSDTFVPRLERNVNSINTDVAFRLGLPWDSQLEIGIPYLWREVESVNFAGFTPTGSTIRSGGALGDLRVGLAKTLLREGLFRPNLIARIIWDTDTGEMEDDGVSLGGGVHELRGSLTATKSQDPLVFVGNLGYQYSFEESQFQAGQVFSGSVGSFIALSPETSMRFLVAGGYRDESRFSGTTIDGSDQVLASFVVGGTTLLSPGLLINLSAEIGLTEDADDFALSMSLPFRLGNVFY